MRGHELLRGLSGAHPSCRIHGPVTVTHPARLTLAQGVNIGTGCFLFTQGGLSIGRNTQLSRFITIYTANHNTRGAKIPYDASFISKPVTIGEAVWIGMYACITPGVTIGDGAIIGMGTVVSKDVAPGEIVVGAATRVIGSRDMAHFEQLRAAGDFYFPGDSAPH